MSKPLQARSIDEPFNADDALEFKLSKLDDGSGLLASNQFLNVITENAPDAKHFHRRFMKKNMKTGNVEYESVFCAQFKGVRIYIQGDNIVMTDRELYL